MEDPNVVIVGAGLAGLACALTLQEGKVPCEILEASDDVGGRVRTDVIDGFRLDRGFQIYLGAYEAAAKWLDPAKLAWRSFEPGARIWSGGRFHNFVDPRRRPAALLPTFFSGVGTFGDKLALRRLRRDVTQGDCARLFARPESTTAASLRQRGFSDRIIQQFFRPFFGGVFLERDLETSSRFFEYTFRLFALGAAMVPARGMGELPRQLAARLPPHSIHLNARVTRYLGSRVFIEGGGHFLARKLVVATDAAAAAQIVPGLATPTGWRATACLYFDVDRTLRTGRLLLLNGEDTGPINHACVLSEIAPDYAPAGRSLVSVSIVDPGRYDRRGIADAVRAQLSAWFGHDARSWRLIEAQDLPRALPALGGGLQPLTRPATAAPGIYVCGDWCATPSIEGAIESGKAAARAIIDDLRKAGDLSWSD